MACVLSQAICLLMGQDRESEIFFNFFFLD